MGVIGSKFSLTNTISLKLYSLFSNSVKQLYWKDQNIVLRDICQGNFIESLENFFLRIAIGKIKNLIIKIYKKLK